jgi:hypothetical protein
MITIIRRKEASQIAVVTVQNPSEINGDNLNNTRRETSSQQVSKNKNIRDLYRGIKDFKRGHQPRSNLVKDGNGDLLVDSHNIVNKWKNYYSQF